MDNLYIVCVLYNSSISEIASLETFLHFVGKYEFVRLMVLDNSSEQYASANTAEWEKKYRDRIIYVSIWEFRKCRKVMFVKEQPILHIIVPVPKSISLKPETGSLIPTEIFL